jgi:hypothetical protein
LVQHHDGPRLNHLRFRYGDIEVLRAIGVLQDKIAGHDDIASKEACGASTPTLTIDTGTSTTNPSDTGTSTPTLTIDTGTSAIGVQRNPSDSRERRRIGFPMDAFAALAMPKGASTTAVAKSPKSTHGVVWVIGSACHSSRPC